MNELAQGIQQVIQIVGMETVRVVLGLIGAIALVIINVVILTWAERKVSAHMQLRYGPNEVGPYGLIQAFADAVKLFGKEIITPAHVERPLYFLAPIIVFIPVLVNYIVIPFDSTLQVKDINVGILVIMAFSSLSVLSLLLAGWGSNNKYSLIGSARSVAQNIAYEIPMLLSLLSVVFMANSLSLKEIVESQSTLWYVIKGQPIAFLIFFVAAVAETNRTPFDLPEAESELVGGFHTEYSGFRFALFFMAEYNNIFIVSAVTTTFFLGGYGGPVLPGIVWFFAKTYFLVFVILWFRWTFPRVRFDQLLNFSWKFLIPLSFLNLLVTAGLLKIF